MGGINQYRGRRRWRHGCCSTERLEPRHLLTAVLGTAFEDENANGLFDAEEHRLAGVTIYVDANRNGQLDRTGYGLDPDAFHQGEVLDQVLPLASLSAVNTRTEVATNVTASEDPRAITGDYVFAHDVGTIWDNTRSLQIDFREPASAVSIMVRGASASGTRARIQVLGLTGELLESVELESLDSSAVSEMAIARSEPEIRQAVLEITNPSGALRLDDLQIDNATGERRTLSGADGNFRLDGFEPGVIVVRQVTLPGYEATSPAPDLAHTVTVENTASNLNFGSRTSSLGGRVFLDQGIPGQFDIGLDQPLAQVGLFLDVNANGRSDEREVTVDPDAFTAGQVLDFAVDGLQFATADAQNRPNGMRVTARSDSRFDPDGKLFSHGDSADWNEGRRLMVTFHQPASAVDMDFISGAAGQRGRLIAFGADGVELTGYQTESLPTASRETMSIHRGAADIQYVVAFAESSEESVGGRLDNLRLTQIDEPVTRSNDIGEYQFRPLRAGNYRLGVLAKEGQVVSIPASGSYTPVLNLGDAIDDLDFGFSPANRQPVAIADQAETVEDSAVAIGVLANDFDSDGLLDFGSIRIVREPLNGLVEIATNGQLVYIPELDFFGTDTLLYTVLDDQGAESNTAIVTILVTPINDHPVAHDDQIPILPGTEEVVIGVLQNDRDVDSELDPNSILVVTPPLHGTIVVDAATSTIRYQSAEGVDDRFRYAVQDQQGVLSNVATVNLFRVTEGIAPIASVDSQRIDEGTPSFLDVLENDRDVDGALVPGSLLIVTHPKHGQAFVMNTGQVEYRPELGYIGDDSFAYQVRDDDGLASNTGIVTLSVIERSRPFQNPLNRHDINADGIVIPRDSLLIINEINQRTISDPRTGQIVATVDYPNRPAAYFDVNGDGYVTPFDVLMVVTAINNSVSTPSSVSRVDIAAALADSDRLADASHSSSNTADPLFAPATIQSAAPRLG